MTIRLIFEMKKDEYRVPENELLYKKNFEYFKGMGHYDDALCHEKALLTTGYYTVWVKKPDHRSDASVK